jgi:hypothetical protein
MSCGREHEAVKVVFLDFDGVLNSVENLHRGGLQEKP